MKYDSYIIFSKHFKEPIPQSITIDAIGRKAMGLVYCDPSQTPPFFIITSSLYRTWLNNPSQAKEILQEILSSYVNLLSNNSKTFIVRSSAKYETFDERGYYKSSSGNIKYNRLFQNIIELWDANISNIKKYEGNEFAIIIQEYIVPKMAGHLSNERRISRNKTEWLIEIVNNKNEFLENLTFKVSAAKNQQNKVELLSTTKKGLIGNLKKIASFLVLEDTRSHIEWVWDGQRGWIVQHDLEINEQTGSEPGSDWKSRAKILDTASLKCFTTVANAKKEWKKIKCIRTFIECDLPHGNVYILEDSRIIEKLGNNEIDDDLRKDIEYLLSYPILIRMDVQRADNILLPRTETLFTIDQAFKFLSLNARKFFENGLGPDEFCFLIHRFIISKSCALSFSKPNIQKARIDSTWGIIEGLYYHPHDSFEVNLMTSPGSIVRQIRCKTEYLDVDNSGKWFSKKAGIKWDWAESLTKEQILAIAEYNVKIADHLDSAVTVMYFVDVEHSTGYPTILPWFYTTDEVTESSEKFTDIIFSENREVIQTENDFIELKRKWDHIKNPKITFKLKLEPGILRDKVVIENIGEYAKEKNIPIELEGSILSHTYYILRKIGARVKCSDYFEPKYKKQKFYKLVRDKIPINIELKGEKARIVKIDSNELLRFLKSKAIEEAYEFYWEKEEDKIIEELADIYEVIRAACKVFGITMVELEKIADKKIEKKGGFETGILLVDTTESSLIDVIDGRGESLLIENNTHEKSRVLQRIRKSKAQKILFGVDNSITLPYIMAVGKDSNEDLEAPVSLENLQGIKISYNSKGIKIKFVKQKENQVNDRQLDLFGNNI